MHHRQAPLIGRERERQALLDLLSDVLGGSGRLALVGGEAGIGKTTLIESFAGDPALSDTIILSGGCYDLETTPPFGPWLEALRSCPEDAARPSRPDLVDDLALRDIASKEQLFTHIADYFVDLASHRPVVVMLEDLHWSDWSSLELLRYLGRELTRSRVLLIASYREEEVTRETPLFRLLPDLIRESRAERIELKPLDTAAMRALIEDQYRLPDSDLTRLAAYLIEHTEGSPFFATELLRAMERDGVLQPMNGDWNLGALDQLAPPPLVVQTIERQLECLTSSTRDALEIATVIGTEIQYELWQAVSGHDDEFLDSALDEALLARVIEPYATASLRFRHALIREVLYYGMRVSRRRQIHRLVAESLMTRGVPEPDPIADHFQRAGDKRALEWLIQAGDIADRSCK